MLKIYTDAAYSDEHKIGCYCLVIVDEGAGTKDWQIHRFDDAISPMHAEAEGIRQALKVIEQLRPDRAERARIYCDSVGAIKQCVPEAAALNVRLRWTKAHQLRKPNELVTEDRKRQHWADVHANRYLKNVLDTLLSTSVK